VKLEELRRMKTAIEGQTDDTTQTEMLEFQRARIGEEAPEEWIQKAAFYPKDRPQLTKPDWARKLAKAYQRKEPNEELTPIDLEIFAAIGRLFEMAVRWEPLSAKKIEASITEDLTSAIGKKSREKTTVGPIAQAALLALAVFVGDMIIKGN